MVFCEVLQMQQNSDYKLNVFSFISELKKKKTIRVRTYKMLIKLNGFFFLKAYQWYLVIIPLYITYFLLPTCSCITNAANK